MTSATVMRASRTLVVKRMTVITTMVRPWMANWARPSWSSCWRFSMSLVMRVMTTPAFSAVKKSSDRRCRWENTLTRRSFITPAANRPVTLTSARCVMEVKATKAR